MRPCRSHHTHTNGACVFHTHTCCKRLQRIVNGHCHCWVLTMQTPSTAKWVDHGQKRLSDRVTQQNIISSLPSSNLIQRWSINEVGKPTEHPLNCLNSSWPRIRARLSLKWVDLTCSDPLRGVSPCKTTILADSWQKHSWGVAVHGKSCSGWLMKMALRSRGVLKFLCLVCLLRCDDLQAWSRLGRSLNFKGSLTSK